MSTSRSRQKQSTKAASIKQQDPLPHRLDHATRAATKKNTPEYAPDGLDIEHSLSARRKGTPQQHTPSRSHHQSPPLIRLPQLSLTRRRCGRPSAHTANAHMTTCRLSPAFTHSTSRHSVATAPCNRHRSSSLLRRPEPRPSTAIRCCCRLGCLICCSSVNLSLHLGDWHWHSPPHEIVAWKPHD